MSQIPTFLRSLSALVRQLVASGRAVHATAKTADELDLLAGLSWDECPATCADIAHGWLRLSSARLGPESGYYLANKVDVLRAAECAELVALCVQMAFEMKYGESSPWECAPYDGTLEGAREAWDFVGAQLDAKPQRIEIIIRPTSEYVSATGWKALADTYRRELEAMK